MNKLLSIQFNLPTTESIQSKKINMFFQSYFLYPGPKFLASAVSNFSHACFLFKEQHSLIIH